MNFAVCIVNKRFTCPLPFVVDAPLILLHIKLCLLQKGWGWGPKFRSYKCQVVAHMEGVV